MIRAGLDCPIGFFEQRIKNKSRASIRDPFLQKSSSADRLLSKSQSESFVLATYY